MYLDCGLREFECQATVAKSGVRRQIPGGAAGIREPRDRPGLSVHRGGDGRHGECGLQSVCFSVFDDPLEVNWVIVTKYVPALLVSSLLVVLRLLRQTDGSGRG